MRRQHPDHQRDLPISMAVHWQLVGASIRTAFQKEDWEIAAEAIDEWVRRHDPDGVPTLVIKGYQWKSLFLPDGTLLRTVFNGENHHCVVENDQILYDKKAVSPSGFVNAVGGIRRNAWRCTWVLRPDDKHWVLADTLRARKPRPRARKAPRAVEQCTTASRAPYSPDIAPARPHEPENSVAEQTFAQANPAPACHDQQPEAASTSAAFSRDPGDQATLTPTMRARGAERRRPGHDSPLQSLRKEMLQLLERMDSLDERRCGTPASTAAPYGFRAEHRRDF